MSAQPPNPLDEGFQKVFGKYNQVDATNTFPAKSVNTQPSNPHFALQDDGAVTSPEPDVQVDIEITPPQSDNPQPLKDVPVVDEAVDGYPFNPDEHQDRGIHFDHHNGDDCGETNPLDEGFQKVFGKYNQVDATNTFPAKSVDSDHIFPAKSVNTPPSNSLQDDGTVTSPEPDAICECVYGDGACEKHEDRSDKLEQILIDCYHTGSMSQQGKTIHSVTVTKWREAINRIRSQERQELIARVENWADNEARTTTVQNFQPFDNGQYIKTKDLDKFLTQIKGEKES